MKVARQLRSCPRTALTVVLTAALAFGLTSQAQAVNLTASDTQPQVIFDDTSGAGFPATHWSLIANDTAQTSSGGLNRFMLRDTTLGRTPFTVSGGAPDNSLFVAPTGRVGLRTANPVLDFHIATTNTPGIRLEQTSAGGFTAETWDVAGNEANFFIRDVTNGSRLPFRIRPGAPTSAIDIAANGNVGVGLSGAEQPLQIRRNDGSARMLIEERNGIADPTLLPMDLAAGDLALLDLSGRTSAFARFANTEGGHQWLAGAAQGGNFTIGNGSPATTRLTIGRGGELSSTGVVSQLAVAASRSNINPAANTQLLNQLRGLPISTWTNSADPNALTHIGPEAPDFLAQFGFGDAQQVAPGDMAGVALAATKAVDSNLTALDGRVTAVEAAVGSSDAGQRIAALEATVDGLEADVAAADRKATTAGKRAKKAQKAAKKALKKLKKLGKKKK